MAFQSQFTMPTLLSGKKLQYSCPPSSEWDEATAMLLSNPQAMEYLLAMSKQDTGGWTVEDAAHRRQNITLMHEEKKGLFCAMVTRESNEFVGICGLRDIDWLNRAGEMGIIVHPNHWGKGYCGEAHYVIFSCAFEELRLERIILVTSSKNTPMITFCRDILQAVHEGTSRHRFARSWSDSSLGYDDTETFSILSNEWPSLKQRLIAKYGLDI